MDDSVERLLQQDDQDAPNGVDDSAMATVLDIMMLRREALIKELRGIDRVLVRHGRLTEETLNRRVR